MRNQAGEVDKVQAAGDTKDGKMHAVGIDRRQASWKLNDAMQGMRLEFLEWTAYPAILGSELENMWVRGYLSEEGSCLVT